MDVALCVCFSQMVPFVVGKVSPVRLPLVSVLCVAGMVLALVFVKLRMSVEVAARAGVDRFSSAEYSAPEDA